MAADEKWYFTKEQLANTPSRKCGIDADKELSYRQQAANFIQDMGQRLVVSQLCINTAIVYMHRFYVFHSLSQFHRNSIAAAALFLAAKVEEQPRKLEHVIKVAHMCLHRDTPALDTKSEQYLEQAQDLVFNENVLLQTLGFDVAIDHPHTHVVRCCHLVKASKDLAQTSYFMASNSLHLTTMCLQYKPTVVACFCIHLACKWSNWEIPQSNEGKYWFWYVDKSVTSELLGQLTGEFLHIFDKCPSRLKRKIRSISANQSPNMSHPTLSNSPFDAEPRKVQSPANADGGLCFQSNRPFHSDKSETDSTKKTNTSLSGRTSVDYREYREKKERERLEREKAAVNASSVALSVDPNKHHSHHHKQSSSGVSVPNKHSNSSSSSSSGLKQAVHHNHHHSSRQDIKSSSQIMAQRHSTVSSQPRDLNRDRQRMSREYNSSSNTSGGTVYSHSHSIDNCLDSTLNSIGQESSTIHPPEKLSNNVHKSLSHDSRGNDPRHPKQQQQQQKDSVKPYTKYADPVSTSSRTSRKPDILEQRSEEVRKLIEKPLPPPKPRAEVLKEEYAAMMLKQSHHPSKYGHQPEKSTINTTQTAALPLAESKTLNVGQTAFSAEKSPNAPVSASQISHKSLSTPSKASQMLPLKNGSSSSSAASLGLLNNLDDAKAEKRPRGQPQFSTERDSNPALQTPPAPTKHRSLFSPEKTPTPSPRESSHSQRSKQKQKTSPALPKQELLPSFASPSSMHQVSETLQMKQRLSNSTSSTTLSLQKQHRGTSNTDAVLEQDSKQHLLEGQTRRLGSTFSLHEPLIMVGNRLSDLSQSSKDNAMGSKATVPSVVDVKAIPEHIKPFDGIDPMIHSNQRHKQLHHGLSNGLDTSIVKQEYSTIDPSSFLVKLEPPDEILSTEASTDLMFMKQEQPKLADYLSYQEPVLKSELTDESELVINKQESFSPLKSAQSISALLQEPLAAVSSLLQQTQGYEQQQQPVVEEKPLLQLSQQPQTQLEPSLPSTVDMSELDGPIQCIVDAPPSTTGAVVVASTTVTVLPVEEKKLEHRSKSEKKKKEKKHKHKDKDKSKDKHKHKHKDKDKEKHHRDKTDREKDNKTEEGNGTTSGNASLGTVPIKITIPKDKLNLSSESIGTSSSTTMTNSSNSSLKIKIPKERLKGTEVSSHQQQQQTQQAASQQAPLKIKIRTDALSRSASELQVPSQLDGNSGSRKRERVDMTECSASGAPPAKKQQQQQRQNGRHNSYNSGSNDKVRGGGRGAGPRLPPYPYRQYGLAQQMREVGYRGYHQQRQSPPPPPPPAFLRHPRPPPHPYFTNYPPAVQAPVFAVGYTAGMYDHAMYYQYQQQQQQQQQFATAMYPTGGMMMTADGQIDTSVPPPSLATRQRQLALGQISEELEISKFVREQPPPPPLPSGPPPSSSPPPPPPPE